VDHFETIRVRKDDAKLDISLTISPVKDASGRIVGISKIARDITERRRVEKALLDSEAALKAADQRKNEFLATLAHELRNPLAPIRNSLHILRMAGTDDPSAARVQEMLERQVNHMSRLVDDLLDVARITSGRIDLRSEPVELASLIRGAVEVSKPLIDVASHRLATTLPSRPVTVKGDAVRLTQVIANLLNNAAKYMEPGGQIWLTATSQGDEAVISVRDTGIGIAPDMLPQVFQMFTQVDRDHKHTQGGLGVGLALAKQLVEMHGGWIEGRSKGKGQGSEFVVRLPLAEQQLPATDDSSPSIDQNQTRSSTILIVDDNKDAAHSLGLLLRMLGHDVQTANDGLSALEVLESYHPTVMLLDLGMPGMDGYEVVRRARELPQCKHTIFVALTGWGQEEDRQRTRDAGFDHHLLKPVNLGALKVLLTEAQGRKEVSA
jgi:signal transduction histidine kinase/ActR/RegA family two-component response regulator